jgi:hypothetical protein
LYDELAIPNHFSVVPILLLSAKNHEGIIGISFQVETKFTVIKEA